MNRPSELRVIAGLAMPTPRQLPPDRAGRAAQHQTDLSKAAAPPILGQNHATFLAAEVLVSSVHRNILCPAGISGNLLFAWSC